jgi:hypothetical protein
MTQTNSEDLVVWRRAADLVPKIYRLLRAFPKEKTYALRDQIRRATVSVPASIAVGQARQHPKEFLQLLSVAKGTPNLQPPTSASVCRLQVLIEMFRVTRFQEVQLRLEVHAFLAQIVADLCYTS